MRAADLAMIEQRLSPERLGPYKRACGGSLETALALYRWNAEVTAALASTIGHVEVTLRNALHQELEAWSARTFEEPRWYLNPPSRTRPNGFLFAEALGDIAKARTRAARNAGPETPGRVVAELNLGFWRFLLARRYDRGLWHPCLHRAFSRQRRVTVFDAVGQLHEARNRMAHHEPMFNRPLAGLYQTSLQIAEWICPTIRLWIEECSSVTAALAARPTGNSDSRLNS
uniref:Abi family protein n=1 Tax=Paractinoplanes polyasparticus TaxID=2856853 RepID=UPI001C862999|nr:Abi family protein [Actinoplanes polyasparticus]